MNGKGSKPRPLSVSRDEFGKHWAETFGGRTSTREARGTPTTAPAAPASRQQADATRKTGSQR